MSSDAAYYPLNDKVSEVYSERLPFATNSTAPTDQHLQYEPKPTSTRTYAIVGVVLLILVALVTVALLLPVHSSKTSFSYVSCDIDTTTAPHSCQDHTYHITTTSDPSNIASLLPTNHTAFIRGRFQDVINSTGWSTLYIESYPVETNVTLVRDTDVMNAVGYLEGYLTSDRISDALNNAVTGYWDLRPEYALHALSQWLSQQQTYVQLQIDHYVHGNTTSVSGARATADVDCDKLAAQGLRSTACDMRSPQSESNASPLDLSQKTYWSAVELIQSQFLGYQSGYEAKLLEQRQLIKYDLGLWMYRSDFGDIFNSLYPNMTKNCWDMSEIELQDYSATERCSSLSKSTVDIIDSACTPLADGDAIESHSTAAIQSQSNPNIFSKLVVDSAQHTQCNVTYFLDFVVTHDTWTGWTDLLRITKSYRLTLDLFQLSQLSAPKQMAQTDSSNLLVWELTLTSYPGILTSYDDFYVLPSQQLIVTETTNTNCDKSLWQKVSPRSILTAQRTLIASLLAVSGESWVDFYSRENSGTYNNQWMVVDGSLYSPLAVNVDFSLHVPNASNALDTPEVVITPHVVSSNFSKGFYHIAEQAPGFVAVRDVTGVINNQTYWGSFNRPYTNEVFFAMGFDKAQDAWGDYYSYGNYSRAKFMHRDLHPLSPRDNFSQPTTSLQDVMQYMQYNDYKNDPLSLGCPNSAIAARYDLILPEGCGKPVMKAVARGQADVKVGSLAALARNYPSNALSNNPLLASDQVNQLQFTSERLSSQAKAVRSNETMFFAFSGPTSLQQAPFDWAKWPNVQHQGHPQIWNFTWAAFQHPENQL